MILIGSRKWGGFKPDSDYDFAMGETEFNQFVIEKKLKSYPGYNELGQYSENLMFNIGNYKVIMGGKEMNFLVWRDKDIEKIATLNYWISKLEGTEIYNLMQKDKSIRYFIVESYLNSLFEKKYKVRHQPDCPDFTDDIPF
jgi:hypothetical protein